MEVGVPSFNGVIPSPASDVGERSPGKGLHVNFTEKGEVKERREKFLTAKYGSHQMSLIRKRLAVEMWLYDELQKLYESTDSSNTEVEVDIDELLDMDDDTQRRRHLQISFRYVRRTLQILHRGSFFDCKDKPYDISVLLKRRI
ncbi:unnamed protein product [Nesidiocoris tenuis]|uniref:Protein phosphatase 1 regulatory subunit 14B n=1 Tax=Nesidiocoris tenuis TaxID=355587 RepID=A0A6H5G2Y0_9HEMI|nr:unnamed protein product [Nesidiocoris tenuis]